MQYAGLVIGYPTPPGGVGRARSTRQAALGGGRERDERQTRDREIFLAPLLLRGQNTTPHSELLSMVPGLQEGMGGWEGMGGERGRGEGRSRAAAY